MSTGMCRASLLTSIFRGIFILAAIVFLCNICSFAQLSTASTITGTVTDSSGALVPAATVTITNDATKVSLQTHSNGRGVYVAPDLNVATYSVTIARAGFKNYTVTGIELHPTETVQVNGTLTVGAASETVTVAATSTDVELSSPALSSYRDIYLTPPTPRYRFRGHGRGLSADFIGTGATFQQRRSLYRVSCSTALARRLGLSTMCRGRRLVDTAGALALRPLPV